MSTTNVQKRSSTATVVAISLMLFVAVFVATRQIPARQSRPPQGYELLAQADLAIQAHEAVALAQFSLAQTSEVGLFFTLQNLRTPAFDLSVEGADGLRFSVMHAEAFRTDRTGNGEWRETLPPGDYRLLLTAAQSAGILTVYSNTP
jgi:hypothetical protein